MLKKIIVVLVIISISSLLIAESLENKLKYFSEEDAKEYLQPLANSMGAGMNSGLFNTAKVLKPFRPSLKIGTALVPIPTSDKTFLANIEGYEPIETATILGKKGAEVAANILLPPGADLSLIALPQASVSLGLPLGNEVMLRFLPEMNLNNELESIWFLGIGLKHSLDQYLPSFLPIGLSVQGFYQTMEVENSLKIDTYSVNLMASMSLLMLTVYGGVGYEQANLEINYTYDLGIPGIPVQKIPLELKAQNEFNATLGARVSVFPLVSVYADYTVARTPTINLGIGVGF